MKTVYQPLWLAFFVLILMLPGCQDLPKRDAKASGISLPASWQTPNSDTSEAIPHWLSSFADPLLTALVHTGLNQNYDLQAAAARVQAAQASAALAGAGRLPQLSFSPSYQNNNDVVSGRFSEFSALFDLSWEIDLWGRIRSSQQVAQHDAEAAVADLRGARLSLAARTAQTYFELVEAKRQVQVAEQSVSDRQAIGDLVRGRFNLGLTRGLDVRLVLTDLANAQARLADARNQVQTITRRLETLLGHYPEGKTLATTQLPAPPANLAEGLPAQLLVRRPDLVAAFARLRSADARLSSAQRALLPRLTLTASGGSASPALAEIIGPHAAAWNLAAGLTQPLFTGGRLQSGIYLQKALVTEALNNYRSTALNAFREVEQALAAEQWLQKQEQSLREAVAQTQESRKLAIYSYRQGLIQILTLLDSYRSTLEAQSAHLAVQRQLLNNRINLYLALGGDVDAIN